ncbi:MAG: HAMP domain-containing histidine kinase [Lachnospiraceae bacterium]|nr:HAMP domain-containing histidine kinase [Lachnospiraceae bacterium]MCI9400543.1 HAMP domain-containing histidine kinase [Lachnospiraceae bacterium]
MKELRLIGVCRKLLLGLAFCAGMTGLFFSYIPQELIRGFLFVFCGIAFIATVFWAFWQGRQLSELSNDICETVDILLEEREPKNFFPYEETVISKVQNKLLQYYEKMKEERQQSRQDKQTIQELVSDISHQVKTPIANIQMITGILNQHDLPCDKQHEFLNLMAVQIDKLEFLMQSLIKMSRLETGIFVLHLQETRLSDTIAGAVSMILAEAEKKNIQLQADCNSKLTVKHDPKWTAEAIGNILDNAVKYTPEGGTISILVRPWQFYTRIDISDTGIGIDQENYNAIFQRFYRAQEVTTEQGIGLGLYLARGIIARQNGYITVKSQKGKGSTFSVFLLS